MDEAPSLAVLRIVKAKKPTAERVPAIVNDDILPDMGRMNGGVPSGGRTISSSVPKQAARPPPSPTP